MLPLMIEGVWILITEQKYWPLAVSTGLSILFNWYTGGINCLFVSLFFVVLMFVHSTDSQTGFSEKIKVWSRLILKYAICMIDGILLSCITFFPAVHLMRNGKGASFDWDMLSNEFRGNPLTAITSYYPGYASWYGEVALFCGTLAVLGCVLFLFDKNKRPKAKILFVLFGALMVLVYFWKPLVFIFSLLKWPNNFWYRYQYITCLLIIYIAAWFFSGYDLKQEKKYAAVTAVSVIALIVIQFRSKQGGLIIYVPAITLAAYAIPVFLYERAAEKKQVRTTIISSVLILGILISELILNAYLIKSPYGDLPDAKEYNTYEEEQIRLVSEIKENDTGYYRITQTSTRSRWPQGTTANYNEAMTFNYMGIGGYHSCPQQSEIDLYADLGYVTYNDCLTVKNTFLLPADSLLGMKYAMSLYDLTGLNKLENIAPEAGKAVYENPYVLPLAFSIPSGSESPMPTLEENIFNNWNSIYSKLTDEKENILQPAVYKESKDENGVLFEVQISGKNQQLYGIIDGLTHSTTLDLNGKMTIPYSRWQTVETFFVPIAQDTETAYVKLLDSEDETGYKESFYLLNLDTLSDIAEKCRNNAAQISEWNNGQIKMSITSEGNMSLFTSIPYDENWKITVNNKSVEAYEWIPGLMCIPLNEGINDIKMVYRPWFFYAGIALTLTGIALLIALDRRQRKPVQTYNH